MKRWMPGKRFPGRVVALLCAAVLLITGGGAMLAEGEDSSTPTVSSTAAEAGTYLAYLGEHSDAPRASESFTVKAAENFALSKEMEGKADGEYVAGPMALEGDLADADTDVSQGLFTADEGSVTWTFNVPATGMYNLKMRYYGLGGKGGKIEREMAIDGKRPFVEADMFSFMRTFRDEYDMEDGQRKKDVLGNAIRPRQVEVKCWMEVELHDYMGYFIDPLQFYLTAGEHTLTLTSVRESMLIESFTFYTSEEPPSYDAVKAVYDAKGYKGASKNSTLRIEAEEMLAKSDKSNFPVNDRTSAATTPQDIYHITLNSMGGLKWQTVGSWVKWTVKVEESGLYRIAPRFRQKIYSGVYVSRKLTIDGEVPFAECETLKFDFDSGWQSQALGRGSGKKREDFLFYFEAGRTYEMGMEVVLGEMGEILRKVQEVVVALNADYRKILMITGVSPDRYRDYYFPVKIPDTLADMKKQSQVLQEVIDALAKEGRKGERISTLSKMVFLLDGMTSKPRTIARQFNMFKDNVAALGTWTLEAAAQPLELDSISLVPAADRVPKKEAGFFKGLGFGFQSFFASFVIDYQSIGTTATGKTTGKPITVWVTSGRDQSAIIRDLIDSSFTPETNVGVNLQLVAGGTLLPSVLAGRGPDVSIGMGGGDPINYAVRGAVVSIERFEGYNDVIQRFQESAMVPYTFNGKAYALPETQSFNMLFYRTDVFDEMGLTPPQTWAELNNVAKDLQKKNMSIGIPHDLNALLMFMYQMDTPLYNGEGISSNLDSPEAARAFKQMTDYFTLYKFPTEYDFANRFRSGEMPLAIADYTMYNQMSLFAPEIRGMWNMMSVPGTPVTDEKGAPVIDEATGKQKIDHATTAGGSAVVMLRDASDENKAWEFMKWWTNADTQSRFSTEMEIVMENAAKQPTANMEALRMMSWTAKDLNSIVDQWGNVRGTPEVPGGYYTTRIEDFAFSKVVNDKKDPADVLQSYVPSLNAELTRKRREFKLEDGK